MTAPLNEAVIVPTGLEAGRVEVTSLQIRRFEDGLTAIVMTDGTSILRMFATDDQVAHLVGLLAQQKEVA
ncbi:MAG: hypothetical protein VB141_11465 [Burkholderia gladioli]